MLAERAVFNRMFRVTPVWIWVLQRASGVLLGPLVAIHILVPGLAMNAALNALLLAVVLAHGYSGVRRMAAIQPKNALYLTLAIGWCLVVAAFGILVVSSGA